MSRLLPIAAFLGVACLSVAALAEDAQPNVPALPRADATQPMQPQDGNSQPAASARFAFQQVKDGFLRLDNQSGAVAFCGPRAVGWACQSVPEDRTALEQEIARLSNEVSALKKELASIKSPGKDGEVKLKLPTREEIEHARAFVEEAWKRLVDMLITMQKDMMRKG